MNICWVFFIDVQVNLIYLGSGLFSYQTINLLIEKIIDKKSNCNCEEALDYQNYIN